MTRDRRSTATGGWTRRSAFMGAMVAVLGALSVSPSQAATSVAGTPGTPTLPRVSAGPYEGYQFCGATPPVVYPSVFTQFAATVEPSEGDPSYPYPSYPEMNGQFEIARPGGEDAPFIQETRPANGGRALSLPLAMSLPEGSYRWRVRAEDHSLTSSWTPWCDFTVRGTV
ncbi:hypothetical protein [Streptomyces sp. BA2]|uniref:hypothetical protein n=1 Tax=Streptomyces sp. BA2 TaxID=436595 RepID=UPI00132386D0|nr:hypothetical protein [Streptomyces sp. BA2]MWA08358.1 hypothetical protein [Streptomyces sp. BA2]